MGPLVRQLHLGKFSCLFCFVSPEAGPHRSFEGDWISRPGMLSLQLMQSLEWLFLWTASPNHSAVKKPVPIISMAVLIDTLNG